MKRYEKYGRKESWIVIRSGKYGRKVSRNVKWYGKYGRNPSWNVKWYGKYGSKVFSFTKQLILHVIYLSLHYALQ